MGINISQIARKALLNAPGTAGRLAHQVRVLEGIGKCLEPEVAWGKSTFSWKYTLAKPFCDKRCSMEIYHTASAVQNTYGGNIFSVIAERILVIIDGNMAKPYGLPEYKHDDDFIVIDDSGSYDISSVDLSTHIQQLSRLMACKIADRHSKTDAKEFSLVLLPADIESETVDQEEFLSLKYKLLANGCMFMTKLVSEDCGEVCNLITEHHGLEKMNEWANQQNQIGAYRLLKGCIQQYSLYRLKALSRNGTEKAYRFLVRFNADIYLLDIPSEMEGDTRAMNAIAFIASQLITDSDSRMYQLARDALKLFGDQVYMQRKGIDDVWINDLDSILPDYKLAGLSPAGATP